MGLRIRTFRIGLSNYPALVSLQSTKRIDHFGVTAIIGMFARGSASRDLQVSAGIAAMTHCGKQRVRSSILNVRVGWYRKARLQVGTKILQLLIAR